MQRLTPAIAERLGSPDKPKRPRARFVSFAQLDAQTRAPAAPVERWVAEAHPGDRGLIRRLHE